MVLVYIRKPSNVQTCCEITKSIRRISFVRIKVELTVRTARLCQITIAGKSNAIYKWTPTLLAVVARILRASPRRWAAEATFWAYLMISNDGPPSRTLKYRV
jgi:hypothetical protein